MASTTQEMLFESFVAASGDQATNLDEIAASLTDVASQMGELLKSSEPQAASGGGGALAAAASGGGAAGSSGAAAGIVAAAASGAAVAASGDGGGSTVASIALTVLKSAFGLVPLVSGLLGLLGGGGSPAPPAPLVKYALPPPISFQAAETESGVSNADYDQAGRPRAYSGGASSGNAGAPQITVNVQAMDARSFLDHSNEIALAVRDAMLNLNAINDVVNDL